MKYSDGFDVSAFHRGVSYNAYDYLGAHKKSAKAIFRVWAPHADKVFLVGDFNSWSESHPMTRISDKGIWECSIDHCSIKENPLYKYKILHGTKTIYKADPYGRQTQRPPETASVFSEKDSVFNWTDSHWLSQRMQRAKQSKISTPINIYQIHLGSFMRHNDSSYMNYRELAPIIASYAKRMSYTHVELLPISEHQNDYSLGYESNGFYSPSSRFGTPDDLKHFINVMHNSGVGVIFSWVPSKFSCDEHGLIEFDGKPLYESTNHYPRQKNDSACSFDLSKKEIQSYLLSNACYYIRDFHIDGLRVCDLCAMLYLDHNKAIGEWQPNRHGGNINFEAVAFIKQLTSTIKIVCPDTLIIADDSGEYKNVIGTRNGGLGFDLKWNDKLKEDSLRAITSTSVTGNIAFNKLSNCILSETDILPLSHTEFTYPKKALLNKMPGEYNMKFAAHRAYTLYTMTLPTKKLSFMSCEFGQFAEWDCTRSIEWFMLDYDMHNKLHRFTSDINAIYLSTPPLWFSDDKNCYKTITHDPTGNKTSVFKRTDDTGGEIIVIISFSDQHSSVTIQTDESKYKMLISTENSLYGGNKNYASTFYQPRNSKLRLDLAPFECVILERESN